MILARAEVEEGIASEIRISRAVERSFSTGVRNCVMVGMVVLADPEKEKKWVGPVAAEILDGKRVLVRDNSGELNPLSISAVKEYKDSKTVYTIYRDTMTDLFRNISKSVCNMMKTSFLTDIL